MEPVEPFSFSASNEFSSFICHSGTSLRTVIIHSMRMSARDAFSILCIPALQPVPCVDLYFEMSSPCQVKSLITEKKYQWFRDGPDFIVWKYDPNDWGSNFGWKLIDDDEIIVWEHKNVVSYQPSHHYYARKNS